MHLTLFGCHVLCILKEDSNCARIVKRVKSLAEKESQAKPTPTGASDAGVIHLLSEKTNKFMDLTF